MPTFRGKPACSCLVEWLPVYEAELKRRGLIKNSIDIWQLIGGAAASAGTHRTGGAFDIAQSGDAIKVARLMGADATWRRTRSQGFDMDHTHGVLRGCPHNSAARYQITAVDAGYNGLGAAGRGGRDNGPRPLSKRSWKQGIAWAKAQQPKPKPKPKAVTFRIGTLNIPLDAAKLPDGLNRVKYAAKQVHDANLHILACQEIDRGYKGDTWYYARLMLSALRVHDKTWKIVKPTTALNENVTFYRSSKAKLKRSLPDVILSSSAGGRHASCSTYTIGGRTVAVRNTHLVQGANNGLSREQQGKELAAISGGGTIILGDFNQHALPKALAKTHKTARDNAKANTNGRYGTHATWGTVKALQTDTSKLDHIVVPKAAVVNGYTVVGIEPDGSFTQPRVSDHQLVIASITFPA